MPLAIVTLPGIVLAALVLWKAEHVGIGPTLLHMALLVVIGPAVLFTVGAFQRRTSAPALGAGQFTLTPGPLIWVCLAGCVLFCAISGYDSLVLHPFWRPEPVDRSGAPVVFVIFFAGFCVGLYALGERVTWTEECVVRRVFGRIVVRYRWDEIELAGAERWTGYVWLGKAGGRRLRVSPQMNGFRHFNETVGQKLDRMRHVGPGGLPPRQPHGGGAGRPSNPA